MDIEQLACNAVTTLLATVGNIDTEIHSNDKTISWDGFVYLGTKENQIGQIPKDSVFGRFPVQVKGKGREINEGKQLGQEEMSYPIETSDLKNYRNDGGTFFFVVYIDDSGTSAIYYANLLPVIIDGLLAGKSNQKTISTWFHTFPQEKEEIKTLLYTFCDDRRRQMSFPLEKTIKPTEIKRYFEPGYSIRSYVSAPNNNESRTLKYLLQNETSFYLVSNGIEIPIAGNARVALTKPSSISVRRKTYFEKCSYHEENGNLVITFGNWITLTFLKLKKITLHFELRGELKERLLTLEFILDVIQSREIQINGNDFSFSQGFSKSLDSQKLRKTLRSLKDADETLKILKVDSDLNLDNLPKEQWQNLNMLISAIKYEEPVTMESGETPVEFFSVDIGNLKILLHRQKIESGKWVIANFFVPYTILIKYPNGKEVITTQYFLLKKKDFLEVSNIDYTQIAESILHDTKSYEACDNYNRLLLEMLLAYDEGTKHQKDLLDSATQIANMIYHYENFPKEISMLNYYQCIKRQRNLSNEEFDKINSFASSPDLEQKFRTGAYLLVDNQGMAKRCFSSMTEDGQKEFRTFPIMRFWKS